MRKMNKREVEEILKQLEYYGINYKELDFLKDFDFYINKEGKIFIVNKNNINISGVNRLGLYILKKEKNGIRFSIEGAQLFSKYIKDKILEIEPEKIFFINKKVEKINLNNGFYVMKYKNDFLGSCYVKNGEVKDFIPKDRKIMSSQ